MGGTPVADLPNFGTIKKACAIIGGDKPIDPSTYYRGAKLGLYPPPDKVAPNVSRVNLDKLAAMLRARHGGGND